MLGGGRVTAKMIMINVILFTSNTEFGVMSKIIFEKVTLSGVSLMNAYRKTTHRSLPTCRIENKQQ